MHIAYDKTPNPGCGEKQTRHCHSFNLYTVSSTCNTTIVRSLIHAGIWTVTFAWLPTAGPNLLSDLAHHMRMCVGQSPRVLDPAVTKTMKQVCVCVCVCSICGFCHPSSLYLPTHLYTHTARLRGAHPQPPLRARPALRRGDASRGAHAQRARAAL